MKVLLDENIPKRLKYWLLESRYEVYAVRDMSWVGLKDNELLKKASEDGLDVFITSDKKYCIPTKYCSYKNGFYCIRYFTTKIYIHSTSFTTTVRDTSHS